MDGDNQRETVSLLAKSETRIGGGGSGWGC